MNETPNTGEPIAKELVHEMTIHGDTRNDEYYWMRNRENPEVIEYLNQENAYREQIMKGTEKLQERLYDEIVGRIKKDDSSVPYLLDGYYYYTRYEGEKEYPLYCRKKGTLEAVEEVILDVNELAEGHPYYQIAGLSIHPNNQKISFGVDTVSRRIYTIYTKDLVTGDIDIVTENECTGGSTWSADGNYLFYTVKDLETLRSNKIKRWDAQVGIHELIFEEEDETFTCFVYKSKSRKYLMIGSSSTMADEHRFLAADNPTGAFQVIQPRERGLEYSTSHFDDHFYIRTNADGATNFKLVKAPVESPSKENWTEVIAHDENILFSDMELFKNCLVTEERSNGLVRIRIQPWGGESYYLPFEEETYTAYVGNNPSFDQKHLRYGYTSLTTPGSVIDYDFATGKKIVRKEQEVLGGYNKSNYETKRIWATADDGENIAMSIVYRKDLIREDGPNPTLLYGYGSYGYTIDPSFSTVRLSLLDRGFVYAIAHIRGSQYMGRPWYEDGKMFNKINTFKDFIACGDALVEQAYASPQTLMAMGGSAGGLLMGSVVNMRPDLFRGVIAAVPFVDVVTTMLDESIPLTTGEFDEWGNPKNKDSYEYMLSYSPYDQVKPQDYPALLITTGLHDSQVQYWEPAKWIARLRKMRTNKDEVLLMYCNMETGHGGASGRFEALKETAMEYAFFLDLMGIKS
ncbi:MAG TPA: oligopeptidase B [Cryomorphaceae bacterium]|nr:oligopeptidase B [Cryomorphaceae bacterium]|tara:strand:- start:3136 stop:5196 length:2061 start_codon:yes stop_codon:yes gene_type:complete